MGQFAWFDQNSGSATHPGGVTDANGFGLFDLSGNVWEWCWDRWEKPSDRGPQCDPRGPLSGSSRVLRGGSWSLGRNYCRSAFRLSLDPSAVGHVNGFRVVRSGR